MHQKTAQRARKHSADPQQEALREAKAKFNAECSQWIADLNSIKPKLISFKRGLNGRGDPQAGIPASNIKDPLPSEVSSTLSEVAQEFQGLSSNFEKLMGEVHSIIQEQSQYSSTRRKPHARQALNDFEDQIIVEASNPISRIWSNIKSYFSSDEGRAYRVSMLARSEELFYKIIEFENLILKKGENNIETVVRKHLTISNSLNALVRGLQSMMQRMQASAPEESSPESISPPILERAPEPSSDDGRTIQVMAPSSNTPGTQNLPAAVRADHDVSIETMRKNIEYAVSNKIFPNKGNVLKFNKAYNSYMEFIDKTKKELAFDGMQDSYILIKNELQIMYLNFTGTMPEPGISFKELVIAVSQAREAEGARIEQIKDEKKLKQELERDRRREDKDAKKQKDKDEQKEKERDAKTEVIASFEKEANPITRYINKLRHERGFADETSGDRLEAYKLARELRRKVNEIMDVLENSNVDASALNIKLSEARKLNEELKEPLRTLQTVSNNQYYDSDEKMKGRLDPATQFMNMRMRRDLRRRVRDEDF